MLLTETQQTFVNGLLGFITLGNILTKRVCIAHNNCWAPIDRQLYLHCSLIYFWVPSSCFQWSASLWGWNNPVQRCLPVGEAALSTPEAVQFPRTDWQTALMPCNRRRPAATSSRRASFSALASANSFVYFASSAATSRWRICMSVSKFASFSSLAFLSRWAFVGNGVITVMINSPWQADDDADNQSGDNRGDSAHTSISLTVPPASLNFGNQAVSLMLELTITSARAVKPRYCRKRSIYRRYHHWSIIGKAPRSLICCNATASWLFGEAFQAKLLAVGIPPTERSW